MQESIAVLSHVFDKALVDERATVTSARDAGLAFEPVFGKYASSNHKLTDEANKNATVVATSLALLK